MIQLFDDDSPQRAAGEYFVGRAVLEKKTRGSDVPTKTLIYGMSVSMFPDSVEEFELYLTQPGGRISIYKLESKKDLKVDVKRGKINFSAYGNRYTIRAVDDRDSFFVQKDGKEPAPVEERKQMPSEDANPTPRSAS